MRNTLSLLAIALVATWGAINLGCAPAESPPATDSSSTSSASTVVANQVAFKVEGMT